VWVTGATVVAQNCVSIFLFVLLRIDKHQLNNYAYTHACIMLSSLTRWLVNKIIREPKGTLRRPLRPSAKPISPRVFCLPSNLICAPCTCDACPMIMSPADHRVVLIFILLCGPFVSRWAGLCVARASAFFCPVPVAADGPLPARGLRSSYATSAMCCLSPATCALFSRLHR